MGFFSSLSGSSQREDARYGLHTSNALIREGRDQALDETDTGLEQSLGYLQPQIDGGNQSRELYENAIGVNGQPAQQGFYDNFQNDPGFQAELDYGLEQTQRSRAASGSLYSGRTLSALADRAQIHQRGAFENRLNRLSGLAQIGGQASSQAAGLTTNAYNRRGDLQFGANQLLGNNYQGYANSSAQSKAAGVNNILGLAGTAIGSFAGGGNSAVSGLGSLFG